VSILKRIFGKDEPRARLMPLYGALVAAARQPDWYVDGQVPDTLDGRFDMVAAMLSLLLIRLEAEGDACASESVQLTEIFVDDMDGQLREIGVGDVVVGKHIGRMMGALGGRLGAYREALAEGGDLAGALVRNVYRGEPPAGDALAWASTRMHGVHAALGATPVAALFAGEWPKA
jgi:cytochrome b pre-mRNA-processing protein 3